MLSLLLTLHLTATVAFSAPSRTGRWFNWHGFDLARSSFRFNYIQRHFSFVDFVSGSVFTRLLSDHIKWVRTICIRFFSTCSLHPFSSSGTTTNSIRLHRPLCACLPCEWNQIERPHDLRIAGTLFLTLPWLFFPFLFFLFLFFLFFSFLFLSTPSFSIQCYWFRNFAQSSKAPGKRASFALTKRHNKFVFSRRDPTFLFANLIKSKPFSVSISASFCHVLSFACLPCIFA